MIKGSKVELVPSVLEDKPRVYDWCFHSETTKSHAGPPDFPDTAIATWEEFFEGDGGYSDYYFTGEKPEHGRGFIIQSNGEPVGFISYSSFHLRPRIAELDIWLNAEAHCGKGFGTEAIILLGDYLNSEFGVRTLIMRPSVKNIRANKSYEKAGLRQSDKKPEEFLLDEYVPIFAEGDYGSDESALLVKNYDS